MKELADLYREALSGRIEAIEVARRARAASGGEAVAAIRRVAHILRGSGGTFGFPEITRAAAAVEDAGDAELDACIENLLRVLRSVAAGPGEAPTGMTILLVDDDPEIRLIVGTALGRVGPHGVLEAADEGAALALARERRPDLILMDVVLGDEDGVAAADRLRDVLGPVPVIFLTGRTRAEDAARMEAAGALGVLHKPFDPLTLGDAIERMLAGG